jgi:tetratricopeptide (TPR) repeat protein
MNLNEIIELLQPIISVWIVNLKDPLILISFTLFILSGLIKWIKPAKLTQKSSYLLFNKGLNFIFILSLLMVILGFALKFMQSSSNSSFKPLDLNKFIENLPPSEQSNIITQAERDANVTTQSPSKCTGNTITQAGQNAKVDIDCSAPQMLPKQGTTNTMTRAGRDATVNITHEYHAIFEKSSDYKGLLAAYEKSRKYLKKLPNDPEIQQEVRTNKNNLEQFKRDVMKLADDFNTIPLNTERLKQAKIAFDAGDFDKARKILDQEAMKKDQKRLLEEKSKLDIQQQEVNTALENHIEALELKTKLANEDHH